MRKKLLKKCSNNLLIFFLVSLLCLAYFHACSTSLPSVKDGGELSILGDGITSEKVESKKEHSSQERILRERGTSEYLNDAGLKDNRQNDAISEKPDTARESTSSPERWVDSEPSTPERKVPEPIQETSPDTSQIPSCSGAHCPIVIGSFPYKDNRDTKRATRKRFSRYNCAPNTDESGGEYLYVFEVKKPGSLLAMLTNAKGVDIDIHLLSSPSASACLVRNDKGLSRHISPGVYYIAADTFVSKGTPKPGAYSIYVHFFPDNSRCGMKSDAIPRINTTKLLSMPATGPVVKEAHLLTAEEHTANLQSGKKHFPTGWPKSIRDRISEHYALSEKVSGYTMTRTEPWAPCCEPTNHYGQGSRSKPPAIAETWYINMRWKKAPKAGTRYIVFNPVTGKGVVAAAGYENGPGNLSRIGGASEEIHHHLGTGHLSLMTFGVARKQSHKYGPIDCYAP